MAHVTEYTCNDCGLELVNDGRAFVWNEETDMTEDFLILMSTYQKFYGAEITGNVSETYCRECERYVKAYSITEVLEGIDDACDVVMKGIENNIREHGRKLSKLKDIRKRSQYTISEEGGHYVVRIPEYESFYYSNYLFPEMSKEEVIEDALKDFHEQIGGFIESYEKRHQRYLDSRYLVVDNTGRTKDEFDISEKVICPECGSEINKHVDGQLPCPRCGGRIFGLGTFYD